MNTLAFIRPDEWNLALFLHVLGALTLIGATTLAAVSLAGAWRDGSAALTQLGFRALLWVGLPAWIVMRIGAQMIAEKEHLEDSEAAWITIGFVTAEPVFLLMVIGTVLAGLAVRRSKRAASEGPSVGVRVATGLVSFALLAYVVAIWAMTTKPV